ncbi:MAG: response regulator [Verrucomicrobia subdivision 3 bacterium]|nr:response regulator [Limisphaerales bacterium]
MPLTIQGKLLPVLGNNPMKARAVLYAEDEENDVMLMRIAWNKAGVTNPLQVVPDGEAAVAYLAGEGKYADRGVYPMPCLMLLDLKLPKIPGLDVLKWIRARPAIQTLQVVVLSSSDQPRDVHAAYARGANAYLVKPANTERLTEMALSLKDFWLSRAQPPPEWLQNEPPPDYA